MSVRKILRYIFRSDATEAAHQRMLSNIYGVNSVIKLIRKDKIMVHVINARTPGVRARRN